MWPCGVQVVAVASALLFSNTAAQSVTRTTMNSNSSPTPTPTNAVTTSIYGLQDSFAQALLQGQGVNLPNDIDYDNITFTASVVTVNPSGTVLDLDCPFTSTAYCSGIDSVTHTIRPSTEYVHVALVTSTMGASIDVHGDVACTAGQAQGSTTSLSCDITATGTISAIGTSTQTKITTKTDFAGVTQMPLVMTAGLEKLGPIPQGAASGMGVAKWTVGMVAVGVMVFGMM